MSSSQMGLAQLRKGKTAERKLAKLLREGLRDSTISRCLRQSREGGHDLDGLSLAAYALEVKCAKDARLATWWTQACAQAQQQGRVPCLAYQLPRQGWRFVLPLGALHPGFEATDTRLTVSLGLESFCAVARETLPNPCSAGTRGEPVINSN